MKINQVLVEAAGATVAFAFGRFNPAHQGHIEVWRTVEQAGANWFIGTNSSTLGPNDPLTFQQKSAWMTEIYPAITGHIVAEQSVLTLAAYIFKKTRKNERATVAYITDAADWAWSGKLLNQYNGVEGAHGYYKFAQITHVPSPRVSSATALRDAARADDKVAFYHASGTDPKSKVSGLTYFDTVKQAVEQYPLPVKKVKKVKEQGVAEAVAPSQYAKLYHSTPVMSLDAILQSGYLAPTGNPAYLSLTRDSKLDYGSWAGSNDYVEFDIDQNAVRQRIKLEPYNHSATMGGPRSTGGGESEERTKQKLPLRGFVTAMHAPAGWEYDKTGAHYSNLLKKYGVPIVYDIVTKIGEQGAAEDSSQKTFTVVYYSKKTDRNVTKTIKANNQSQVWDQLKSKGIDVVSVKEQGLNELAPSSGFGGGDDDDKYTPADYGKPFKANYLGQNKFEVFCRKPQDPSNVIKLNAEVQKYGLEWEENFGFWFLDSPGAVYLSWKYGEIPLPKAIDQARNPGHIHDLVTDYLTNSPHAAEIQKIAIEYFGFTADGEMSESVAEDNLKEFAPGSGGGESGRWYTDDQMTDLVGDGWWNDLDISGDVSKQEMIQEAQAWLDDQGYSVQVLNCKVNDDDMEWYIEGSFQNSNFAKKGMAEEEQKTVAKTWDQMTAQEKSSGVKGRTVWNEKTQRYYTVFDVPANEVDEASLATMRDYFAGDENARDPMDITKQRNWFNQTKDKNGRPTVDKRFRSPAEYQAWLKQNKLRQISGANESTNDKGWTLTNKKQQ